MWWKGLHVSPCVEIRFFFSSACLLLLSLWKLQFPCRPPLCITVQTHSHLSSNMFSLGWSYLLNCAVFFFFFYDRLGWRWANQKIHKWSRSKKNMRTCSLNTKDSMICSKRRDCSKRGDWGQRVSYAFKKLLTLLPTFLHTIIVPTASCTQYLLVPYSKYSTKILKMGHLMEVIRIDF